jgi:hypothetical protein
MDIPPPPWRAQQPEQSQAVNVPPPPWRASSTPALDQFSAQVQNDSNEQARTLAQGEINARQRGVTFEQKTPGVWGPVQSAPPQPLSPSEKLAVISAYGQEYAGHDPNSPQSQQEMEAQVRAASQAGNGVVTNFGGAMGSAMGHFGTSVLATVAPQTANNLNTNIDQGYAFDPDSKAAFVGGVVGNTLPLVPAMAAGPGGVEAASTAMMGASGFGNVRANVAARRANGENIPVQNELAAAGLEAAVMLGASKVRLGSTAESVAAMRSGIARAIAGYAQNAGIQATDMMVMTAANNAVERALIDPNTQVLRGVPEAGAAGAAMGFLSTPIAGLARGHAPAQDARQVMDQVGQQPGTTTVDVNGQSVTQAPPAPDVSKLTTATPAPSPEAKLNSSLENHTPKVRVQDGGQSRGVPLEFESPEEKALFVATQPRKGKLSREASAYLTNLGYDDAAIQNYGGELRNRVDQLASGHQGDSLRVPRAEAATPEVAGSGPAVEQKQEFLAARPQPDVKQAIAEATQNVKNFQAQLPQNRDQAQARDIFRKRGVELVYYTGEGRGVRLARNAESVLFINTKNVAEGLHEAVTHEFMHELKAERPGLYGEFMKAIPPEMLREASKTYEQAFAKMRPGEQLSAEKLIEEGVATIFGKLGKTNRVWEAALNRSPGLLTKIMDFVRSFTSKFSAKSRLVDQALKTFQATLENPVGNREIAPINEADLFRPTRRRSVSETSDVRFLPESSQPIRDEAEDYARTAGIPYKPDHTYASLDEGRAKKIAAAYDAMTHSPNDPKVKASYEAFKKETLAQYEYLKGKGIKFEPWGKDQQPYASSAEMLKDVRDNRHLGFFQGGDMPADHPLAENVPGTDLSYNDVFRAVHDYFGHAKEGVGFGPRGEENAWRSHSQLYSDVARGAMTAETRGQNSWVNFGPHGEANRANPKETKYAEQKAGTLPPEFSRLDRSEEMAKTGAALEKTLKEQTGVDKLEALHADVRALSEKMDRQLAERPSFLPSSPKAKAKALENIETTELRDEPIGAKKGLFGQVERTPRKVEEVAHILNERTKQLAGQAKARESEKLARAVAAGIPEAEYQLKQPDSGKDWYKADIAKMERSMQTVHPSLKQPENMTIFKAILGHHVAGKQPQREPEARRADLRPLRPDRRDAEEAAEREELARHAG